MQNFDPLVANGILYAPVKTLLNSDMPVDMVYNPQQARSLAMPNDVYVPQHKRSKFKKIALGILAAVGLFIAFKKFNPTAIKSTLSKIKNNLKPSAIINYCKTKLSSLKNIFKKA